MPKPFPPTYTRQSCFTLGEEVNAALDALVQQCQAESDPTITRSAMLRSLIMHAARKAGIAPKKSRKKSRKTA